MRDKPATLTPELLFETKPPSQTALEKKIRDVSQHNLKGKYCNREPCGYEILKRVKTPDELTKTYTADPEKSNRRLCNPAFLNYVSKGTCQYTQKEAEKEKDLYGGREYDVSTVRCRS